MYEKIIEKKEGKADAGKDSEAEGVLSRGKTHYIGPSVKKHLNVWAVPFVPMRKKFMKPCGRI